MITAVEGRPGMGKTVWLVGQALYYGWAGYYVPTNIELRLPPNCKYRQAYLYIESLEDIVSLNIKDILNHKNWRGKPYKGIKVVLDELQTYLNSRNWDKLDIRFQLLLQQHRKRGMDIIGATQSIKRADVVFRELIQVFYRIRKIVSFRIPFTKKAFGFFYLREYDPDDIESGGAKSNQVALSWPILYFADPFTLTIYDTTQEYEPISRVGTRVVEEYVIVSTRPFAAIKTSNMEIFEGHLLPTHRKIDSS